MLGELLAGVEAEHGDVHPVAPLYDLGDNGTGLDGDFAGEIGDQRMRHNAIIVRPTLTVNVPDTLTHNRAVARDRGRMRGARPAADRRRAHGHGGDTDRPGAVTSDIRLRRAVSPAAGFARP